MSYQHREEIWHGERFLGWVAFFPEDSTWRASSSPLSLRFGTKAECVEHLKRERGVA